MVRLEGLSSAARRGFTLIELMVV
ncbi:MAG: prepilin-type N-terminal cleavage/methylation domain-containing protein, partial [Phycisphaerae bacterium]|nr:prepilin-type N-terminal cleavage/methylation domain-containing protein [Phycisphaerae bacterium]